MTRVVAVALIALVALALRPSPAAAQPAVAGRDPLPVGRDHRVQVYRLESVELTGTSRMSSSQVSQELGLTHGTPLDDEFVMTTRTRLLGLGFFKSVILIMHKGTRPGYAKLVIDVEDDDSVLGDWAVGGELAATIDDSSVANVDPNSAPMDYRVSLIARNLFSEMHRGALLLDMDSTGIIRQGQIAYGLPRFTREDEQFDAQLYIVNPYYRYLDALGFGGRGEGLWSHTLAGIGELQYGAAMYVNKTPDFAVTGFPDVVAGPKVAFYHETRLRGFFPGAGQLTGASLLLNATAPSASVIELTLAHSWSFTDLLYGTLDGRALAVGAQGFAFRAEARADIALGHAKAAADQAALFMRLRAGRDAMGATRLIGEEAVVGLRYHSSGFIAELALKITRPPEQLAPQTPLSQLRPGGLP